MTEPKVLRARGGWLAPTIITVAGVAVLVALGMWQLDRKVWKENLIQTLHQRLGAPAVIGLPPPEQWSKLQESESEFRRYTVPVEFLNAEEALVYTSGSGVRPDVKGMGYWVLTPARLPGGSLVVVNRGFVPIEKKDPATRREGNTSGPVDITGVLRWPEHRSTFTPTDEPQNNIWYVRNQAVIAEAKRWGAVAPFVIDLESPQPAGGLPRAGKLEVNLTDNHLQYALTWFFFAITLVVIYLTWMFSRFRR